MRAGEVIDFTDVTDSSPAPATDLPTAFAPAEVEGPLYERWVQRGYFEADDHSDRPPFCIVIPPPNVTGSLHLGHAFEHTLIDALIRRRRMQGYEALWMPGMDHAGIATQNVVERELAKEGLSRHDIGREAFVERVWQWKERSGNTISQQLRRLGASVDWTRDRFTMDEGLSRAVTEVLVRLHDEGLIYRGKRLVNWDPVLQTALSDLDVLSTEERGKLWHLRYPLADEPTTHLVVATTRPETMLGDTAVAVHPDDERYRHLIGKEVVLPLAVLQRYPGTYRLQPGFDLVITLENGQLMSQATGQAKAPLYAESERKFFLKVANAQIEFVGDGERPAELVLNQGGRETHAPRQ